MQPVTIANRCGSDGVHPSVESQKIATHTGQALLRPIPVPMDPLARSCFNFPKQGPAETNRCVD